MSERAPAQRILRAAEVLIAERGIGASLQDVAAEAGLRNKSAVQYYFGSRDRLIAEAVNARLAEMETARLRLLAEAEVAGRRDDVRTLVAMLVLPMVQIVDGPDSTHFARFLDRLRYHPAVTDDAVVFGEGHQSLRIIIGRLTRSLTSVREADRRFRTDSLATCLLGLVADYERSVGSLGAAARSRRHEDLVDVLTGLVSAPSNLRAVP
ncbi:TetR family transcriptional regulator [Pimelobacter simplex]|uniref:TetR family transcriptional regulator n=1 Tax=Nocardioides simplex TaxID=2045 RepID=UPI001932E317|nr:TetR family transcriptional regulator [Pimelobacter simplex]